MKIGKNRFPVFFCAFVCGLIVLMLIVPVGREIYHGEGESFQIISEPVFFASVVEAEVEMSNELFMLSRGFRTVHFRILGKEIMLWSME